MIDFLPDCGAATLAIWLGAHSGVEIVCRDRGQSYAEGARVSALSAIHVADRFHLVHNLVNALKQACGRYPPCAPHRSRAASRPSG